MQTFSAKFIALFLVLCLNYIGLFDIGRTIAFYFDNENSEGNIFTAGSLDFSIVNNDFSKTIGLTKKITLDSVLLNSGTIPFKYIVGVEKISGSDDFCNALKLVVELNGIEKHDDSLMSLSSSASTMLGSWTFEIKMPYIASNVPHGSECEFDFVFKGWQEELASYESGGFTDEERIHVVLTANMIVLNEFLPKPNGIAYGFDFGDDSSDMPQGEWVEIYNNSDASQDLSGWYTWDASGSESNKIYITDLNTYPASTVIGGKSWLVVFMNKAVLNNTGDTVKLYDAFNNLMDSYSYSNPPDYCNIEPTPGDENNTTATGSCTDVPPNKSYARIPDGIGYWVDPVPTPGGMNSLYSVFTPISDVFAPQTSSMLPAVEEIPVLEEEIIFETEEDVLQAEGPIETELIEEEFEIGEQAEITEEVIADELLQEELTEEELSIIKEEIIIETEILGLDEGEGTAEEQPVLEEAVIQNDQEAIIEEQLNDTGNNDYEE